MVAAHRVMMIGSCLTEEQSPAVDIKSTSNCSVVCKQSCCEVQHATAARASGQSVDAQ